MLASMDPTTTVVMLASMRKNVPCPIITCKHTAPFSLARVALNPPSLCIVLSSLSLQFSYTNALQLSRLVHVPFSAPRRPKGGLIARA